MGIPPDRPGDPVLSFLGAAGTVTGSRFLLDTPRARVLVDCGPLPGPEGSSGCATGSPSRSTAGDHRRRRAHPRARRPRRLPAGARARRLRGPGLRHAGHARAGRHRAARLRPPPGGGGGVRQPQGVLEAPPGAAALHRGRRPAVARPVRRWHLRHRASRSRRACTSPSGPPATSSARRSPLMPRGRRTADRRIVFSGDLGRPQHPILRPPRRDRPSRRRRDRVDLRRPAPRRRRTRSSASATRSSGPRHGAARCSSRRSPSTAPRSSCSTSAALLDAGAIPDVPDLRRLPDGARGAGASTARPSTGASPDSTRARRARRPLRRRTGDRGPRRRGLEGARRPARSPRSSCRRRAWRPAAASCTTSPPACPIIATRAARRLPGRRARGAGCSPTAPAR